MPIFDIDLDDALVDGLDVVLLGGLDGRPGEQPWRDHVVERLEREVRVDRRGAVADQQRRSDAPRAARRSRAPGRPACASLRGSGGDAPPRTASSAGIGASRLVVAAVGQDDAVVALGDRLARPARAGPRSRAARPGAVRPRPRTGSAA